MKPVDKLTHPRADDRAWKTEIVLPARAYDDPKFRAALNEGLVEKRRELIQHIKQERTHTAAALRSCLERFSSSLDSLESALRQREEEGDSLCQLQRSIMRGTFLYTSMQGNPARENPDRLQRVQDDVAKFFENQPAQGAQEVHSALYSERSILPDPLLRRKTNKEMAPKIQKVVQSMRKDYTLMVAPQKRALEGFVNATKAIDRLSRYGLAEGAKMLEEQAKRCIQEITKGPQGRVTRDDFIELQLERIDDAAETEWERITVSLYSLVGSARSFQGRCSEVLHDIAERAAAGRIGELQRERLKQGALVLRQEIDQRLSGVAEQVGKLADVKLLLVAMDFHLLQGDLQTFEGLAQRFVQKPLAERKKALKGLESILREYSSCAEESQLTARAARLSGIVNRAGVVGAEQALKEDREVFAQKTVEPVIEESPEVLADISVIRRFVENEDLQRRIRDELCKSEFGVELFVQDVCELLSQVVGEVVAGELIRDNPELLVGAYAGREGFEEYLEDLRSVVSVIQATLREGTYSPRFFSSREAIQALIASEGAELVSAAVHPEARVIEHLVLAGVSSPRGAYAILRFGFYDPGTGYVIGRWNSESARFQGVYAGILGPVPAKDVIRAQETELEKLGAIALGPNREASLKQAGSMSGHLAMAMRAILAESKPARRLAVRVGT